MKKILFISLFLSAGLVFAQTKTENPNVETTQKDVDKLAEFPGGINEFRNIINQNFRTEKLKIDKGIAKTTIVFVINEDGTVSDIEALGENQAMNDESIRVVSKIKTKWKPAELDGEKVKYRFTMPLTMSFE
ncbi:MAG: energy transducer TonB [Flavobacteriia bacterium]|nr:energy transducer TonB [Flavobacteriia bacterium]MBH2023583.1 energy transducer TonB [Flavobacteriales bacterium]